MSAEDDAPIDISFRDFVDHDPRPIFIIDSDLSGLGRMRIRFKNSAFIHDDSLNEVLSLGNLDCLRFRSWCLSVANWRGSYEFAARSWTAYLVGDKYKVIQAYDTVRPPMPSHNSNQSESSSSTGGVSQILRRGIKSTDARLDTLQLMLEMSDIGVFEYAPSGRLDRANESWYRLSGHPRTDSIKADFSFMDLVYEDDIPLVMQQWNTLSKGEPTTFEMRWKAAPGQLGSHQHLVENVQWVVSACVPVFNERGELVSIAGNTVDISAQKKSQCETLRRAEALEQLRISEQRFTHFATVSPIAIYYFGPTEQLEYANEQFWHVLGAPKVPFAEFDWTSIMHPDDSDIVYEAWRALLEDHKPTNIQFRLQKEYVAPDGSRCQATVHSQTYPEIDAQGNLTNIVGTCTDVSHFKWVENLQRLKAEEAMEAKRQQENFIDMTSHEMRNPLSAVIQCTDSAVDSVTELSRFCEISLQDQQDTLQQAQIEVRNAMDALQTIITCSMHQKRIIDDILTLSKLDSSLLQITPVRVQMTAVLAEAVKMFDIECAKADIDLSYEVDRALFDLGAEWCMLDPSRLLQVLINLLTNAIKFTRERPERRINIKMSASEYRPSANCQVINFAEPSARAVQEDLLDHEDWGTGKKLYLSFRVSDTGCGIEHDQQGTLFSRFQQASPRTHVQYGGSGLGLFISKSLTELQCGEIGITSTPGVGSTFAFFVGTRVCPPPITSPVHQAVNKMRQRTSSTTRPRSPRHTNNLTPTSSHSDTGSITPVALPVLTRSPPADLSIGDPLAAASPAKPLSMQERFRQAKYSVLIVEDNLVNQKVLAQQLRKTGCTVHVAGHGVAALDFIKTTTLYDAPTPAHAASRLEGTTSEQSISEAVAVVTASVAPSTMPKSAIPLHVILMDIEMPVMDGLTATKEIRRMEKEGSLLGHVPILAVSANARSEQVKTAIEVGMDGAVSKPFRIVDIIPRIMGLVDDDAVEK